MHFKNATVSDIIIFPESLIGSICSLECSDAHRLYKTKQKCWSGSKPNIYMSGDYYDQDQELVWIMLTFLMDFFLLQ